MFSIGSCTHYAPNCRSRTKSWANSASYGIDHQPLTGICGHIHLVDGGHMTDTMGRMHSDAQFAGSSSVPAHVEMMGFLGMGNNPMVGATVAIAVAIQQAMN